MVSSMVRIGRLGARFKTDEVFNEEVLSILNKHKDMLAIELYADSTILASVPVYMEEGEFKFPSSLFSFVDYRWFTDNYRCLVALEGELIGLGYKIDVVGLTGGISEDVGVGLVKCMKEKDFVQSYDTKMNSKLRQAQRYSKNLSYKFGTVDDAEPFIREWFLQYDNPDVELVLELYRYWEKKGVLSAMRVTEHLDGKCRKVAYDILLNQDGILCGLLTPWNKDDEHIRKLWIGWYVIIKACEFGKAFGCEWFSLGDTIMDYKKKFVVETMPTYYIGLGRREFRDE